MNIGIKILNKLVLEFQNRTNKYFAQYRVRKVNDAKFTVISNNCWAGSLYRWLGCKRLRIYTLPFIVKVITFAP